MLEKQLTKIRFVQSIGGLTDIFYIHCMLRKIELVKHLFILELEQGQESIIPADICCDRYPISFQYYDPVIQIINKLMPSESKKFFQFNLDFNLNKIIKTDKRRAFLINIGVFEDDELGIEQKKQVYKPSLIN